MIEASAQRHGGAIIWTHFVFRYGTEIKRDGGGDLFQLSYVIVVVFFVSNPYHVVLNRQSSGERGAFVGWNGHD